MNRLQTLTTGHKLIGAFFTAGDPSAALSLDYLLCAAEAGADLIELGIPFSDPIAEGVGVQAADLRALSAGMRVSGVFELVHQARKSLTLPLVVRSYLNPILSYGAEAFFKDCQRCGVDGVRVCDMPFEEREPLLRFAQETGVELISSAAPSSPQRIARIAQGSGAFLALCCAGSLQSAPKKLEETAALARQTTQLPLLAAVDVPDIQWALRLAESTDGILLDSLLVSQLTADPAASKESISRILHTLREALQNVC